MDVPDGSKHARRQATSITYEVVAYRELTREEIVRAFPRWAEEEPKERNARDDSLGGRARRQVSTALASGLAQLEGFHAEMASPKAREAILALS